MADSSGIMPKNMSVYLPILLFFFTFAILIMLFSKRAKSMKTGHKTHIPGIGNRKKSTSMNRFAIFITALLIASGCSTEKHDDEQFFYPYKGINRFSVEYSGDTILLTARYTAEEETIKLYPKNGEYYRRSEDFGEELVMTVKDVPRYELYNRQNPSEGYDDREKTALSFNQEYALESVWHEFRHAAAVGWKDVRLKTPLLSGSMEVINQFCARLSYPSFVRSLGGKASHAKKVMENGYGYGRNVSNFCTLLKQMKVSQKSAYRHFQDMIIKTPYEDIHGELVRFVELRGKYDKKKAEAIVSGLGFLPDAFKALL